MFGTYCDAVRPIFMFYGFTSRGARPASFGGVVFLFFVFMGILFSGRPPAPPSFVARRKIGEKGVPRGCGPLNPRGNVLGHSDVLCAYVFATVRVTRLSRAWRAPHCFHALCVLRCQGSGSAYDFLRSLRTSAHTGVAIRIPHRTHNSVA